MKRSDRYVKSKIDVNCKLIPDVSKTSTLRYISKLLLLLLLIRIGEERTEWLMSGRRKRFKKCNGYLRMCLGAQNNTGEGNRQNEDCLGKKCIQELSED